MFRTWATDGTIPRVGRACSSFESDNAETVPARSTPLPARTSVVIVGGGVVGTSAAFHLAEAGVDVVLLERDTLGGGSTSRAAGGVRAQFSDALNIQLAQRSLAAFRDFGRRPGREIDLHRVGYLFVLSQPRDVEAFASSVALQNEYGVPSRMLSADDARALCPLLTGEDILAAAFSPEDGYVTPDAVVAGYAFAARALGAVLRSGCEVHGIDRAGNAITGVQTSAGAIETDTVICAAGAWSAAFGAMAGVVLPVTPLRRQILFTEAMAGLPDGLPMTIDFASSMYFHREGPGLLVGMSDPGETPGFSVQTSDDWIPGLLEVAARRAPRIAEAGIRGGWAGLYEMTPDHNAIIGEAPGVSRFLYATGFSGHGFLQGPAIGEILRDLVLGREPFVDIGPLAVERFGADELRPEFHVV
jgi:sarcosine oxidase subunit beta